MNYEFKKVDLDTFKLIYTNKEKKEVELEFKRTVEMGSKLQGITATARINMFKELTKLGLTKNDLIIKRDDGKGHITYDETNYQEFEKKYIEEESVKVLNELIENCFKKNIVELFEDMGMDITANNSDALKEITIFTQKFSAIITNKEDKLDSPSESNKE